MNSSGPFPGRRKSMVFAVISAFLLSLVALSLRGKHVGSSIALHAGRSEFPVRRRANYERHTNVYTSAYDDAWTKGGYPAQSCWGCRFVLEVVTRLGSELILDAGTGNGAVVRKLRDLGFDAYGIEQSESALQQNCPDLVENGYVEVGVLTSLPYEDRSFDLVFSSDVLEHLLPEEADRVVSELTRVARRDIFLSISLKPHTKTAASNDTEAFRHTLLRPRDWWTALFEKHGARVNKSVLSAVQETYKPKISHLQAYDCKQTGYLEEGGLYDVCVLNNTWLVGEPEQANVRKDRCITTSNGEVEPWFFSFSV